MLLVKRDLYCLFVTWVLPSIFTVSYTSFS